MSRVHVRQMKRALNQGRHPAAGNESAVLAREAAAQLLERSIRFGHGRLAVIRLLMAVESGVAVPAEQWNYCRHVAGASQDISLQALFLQAVQVATLEAVPQ